MKKHSSARSLPSLFTTAYLILALSASSFGMGPKSPWKNAKEAVREANERKKAEQQAAQARRMTATPDSKSNRAARGTTPNAVDLTMMTPSTPAPEQTVVTSTETTAHFETPGLLPERVTTPPPSVNFTAEATRDAAESLQNPPEVLREMSAADPSVADWAFQEAEAARLGSLTREEFATFLKREFNFINGEIAKLSAQNEVAQNREAVSVESSNLHAIKVLILTKALCTGVRLYQEYVVEISPSSLEAQMRENDECASMKVDQRNYRYIHQTIKKVLDLPDQAPSSETLDKAEDCLKLVTYLNSYFKLNVDDLSHYCEFGDEYGGLGSHILNCYKLLINQSLELIKIDPAVTEEETSSTPQIITIWKFEDDIESNKDLLKEGLKKYRLAVKKLSAFGKGTRSWIRFTQRVNGATLEYQIFPLAIEMTNGSSRSASPEVANGTITSMEQSNRLIRDAHHINSSDTIRPIFTRCRILSGISLAVLVAAIVAYYEHYLHSLQAIS